MASKQKPQRSRTAQRALARNAEKLFSQRARLATFEPGGSPANPIGVAGAATVESRALQLTCLSCEQPLAVFAHDAVVVDAKRLRRVTLKCKRCGQKRVLWLRIEGSTLN